MVDSNARRERRVSLTQVLEVVDAARLLVRERPPELLPAAFEVCLYFHPEGPFEMEDVQAELARLFLPTVELLGTEYKKPIEKQS